MNGKNFTILLEDIYSNVQYLDLKLNLFPWNLFPIRVSTNKNMSMKILVETFKQNTF